MGIVESAYLVLEIIVFGAIELGREIPETREEAMVGKKTPAY